MPPGQNELRLAIDGVVRDISYVRREIDKIELRLQGLDERQLEAQEKAKDQVGANAAATQQLVSSIRQDLSEFRGETRAAINQLREHQEKTQKILDGGQANGEGSVVARQRDHTHALKTLDNRTASIEQNYSALQKLVTETMIPRPGDAKVSKEEKEAGALRLRQIKATTRRDRVKLWLGIVALLTALLALFVRQGPPDPDEFLEALRKAQVHLEEIDAREGEKER